MKNRIIALLLWILIGISIWIYTQYELKEKREKEITNIINEMTEIEYKKKQFYINKQKQRVLETMNTDKSKYSNMKSNLWLKIEVYDYNQLYKRIYNLIINNKDVKEKIGYKEFKNTKLYKRLISIKSDNLHTKVIYNNWKEVHYPYIPINISCNGYCKKKINLELENIFNLDHSILKTIIFDSKLPSDKELINFIRSKTTMYQYFSKKK